ACSNDKDDVTPATPDATDGATTSDVVADVTDDDGGSSTTGGDEVAQPDVNDAGDIEDPPLPPEPIGFLSTPSDFALAKKLYRYPARVSALGSPTWTLAEAPAGMTIDDDGTIEWVPTVDQTGAHTVTVRAELTDQESMQTFTVYADAPQILAKSPVGDAGGAVTVIGESAGFEGAGVVIPQGAVAESIIIEIAKVGLAPLPSGIVASEGSSPMLLSPAGTHFSKPVTVYLPYDTAVESPNAWICDEIGGNWEPLPILDIDQDAGLIVTETTHFSMMRV
ncbi:MAG: hypothetical protein ACI9WU_003781, partial [Myxococcota bacterium]